MTFYTFLGKKGHFYKLNANCSKDVKQGEGPGSCGGDVNDSSDSNISHKIDQLKLDRENIKLELYKKENKNNESRKQELRSQIGSIDDKIKELKKSVPKKLSNNKQTQLDKPLINNSLNDNDKNILKSYTNGNSEGVNYYLGTGKVLSRTNEPYIKERIKELDSVFDKSSLKSPMKVYRGIDENDELDDFYRNWSVGSIQTVNGYSSTTESLDVAKQFTNEETDFTVLEIDLPKGFKAIPISEISEFPAEKEVLLNRGTKFKVMSKKIVPLGKYYKYTSISLKPV